MFSKVGCTNVPYCFKLLIFNIYKPIIHYSLLDSQESRWRTMMSCLDHERWSSRCFMVTLLHIGPCIKVEQLYVENCSIRSTPNWTCINMECSTKIQCPNWRNSKSAHVSTMSNSTLIHDQLGALLIGHCIY